MTQTVHGNGATPEGFGRPTFVKYGGTSASSHHLQVELQWGAAAHDTVEARDGVLHDTFGDQTGYEKEVQTFDANGTYKKGDKVAMPDAIKASADAVVPLNDAVNGKEGVRFLTVGDDGPLPRYSSPRSRSR